MSVKDYSTTPGNNASKPGINFAEGQVPSSLNDSSRALMADLAEWYAQISAGTISGTVTGNGNAIALAPTPTVGAYATNQRFLVKAPGANSVGNPTLNVSGLGTRTIIMPGGGAVPVPGWSTGDMLLIAYDGTNMMLIAPASSVADGAVTTNKIANGAVTLAKMANNSVGTDNINDGNVTASKLATNAVTTAKILDLNVTTGKIADGAVTAAKLAASEGICKVAVEWGGDTAGANKTLYQSLNVSTVADNGTGDFTVNFTTSFAASAYSGGHLCAFNTGGNIMSIKGWNSSATKVQSSYRVITSTSSGISSSAADQSSSSLVLFGPQ